MTPRDRTLLGQYFTPRPVADLLAALTIRPSHTSILDPACGAGDLLHSASELLTYRAHPTNLTGGDLLHSASELLTYRAHPTNLAGIEIDPAAAARARARLPAAAITTGDFFAHDPAAAVDCILANPPYVRSQHQDDRDPDARRRLFAAAARVGVDADPKTDLYAFFLYHALACLRPGGRLGFITPASWLTSRYAHPLQKLLTGPLRLSSIVASDAESFFPDADIHTVLLIADRPDSTSTELDPPIKFVTLHRPLPRHPDWPHLTALADEIHACTAPRDDPRLRIRLLPAAPERAALEDSAAPRNWSRPLRAPRAFDLLAASPAFVPLHAIAHVALGYKSLQNDFYYLDAAALARHPIEPRYLRPIYRLADLDAARYLQTHPAPLKLFHCRDPEPTLKNTRALDYIHTMADRPAARRKQSAGARTIRDVLTAQGGGLWYAPKARPHPAHIWLRKAVDGTFAPLLFQDPAVVDQRCNSVTPEADLEWPLLAAVLTSSLFALAVEVLGSASLGAGALEATTLGLRDVPVLDPRRLATRGRAELLTLARAAWTEPPHDWRAAATPGPHLHALDAWLLTRAAVDLSAARLHTDLHATCRARIALART
jgi:SAM-dependent methyltransferase